ncbi:MAG: hypothetical protein LBF97_02260 [Elusimicrobiota bacterium]|jgi:hypothetical protein|nr:hypothetical protein [Elusimicrobiota bacterium]
MKFNDVIGLLEADVELAHDGDQIFDDRGNLTKAVGPNYAKAIAEIKKAIVDMKLWDKFKKRDITQTDIKFDKIHRNLAHLTDDYGKQYIYDLALHKLRKDENQIIPKAASVKTKKKIEI